MASFFQGNANNPSKLGLRGGYTLLGSSIAKSLLKNQPIMHTTIKTIMHNIKWVEACVSLAFLEFKLLHLSQQNVLQSKPNYNVDNNTT
jgi:hypothetical protein